MSLIGKKLINFSGTANHIWVVVANSVDQPTKYEIVPFTFSSLLIYRFRFHIYRLA